MASSVITYLDLAFGNILGLSQCQRCTPKVGRRVTTYQVADHDLALAAHASALGRRGLGGAARRLCVLLNATGRRGGSGPSGASGAALRAAAALLVAPLVGEDLIKRLVELAGHDGDGKREMDKVGWLMAGRWLGGKRSSLTSREARCKSWCASLRGLNGRFEKVGWAIACTSRQVAVGGLGSKGDNEGRRILWLAESKIPGKRWLMQA